MKEGVHESPLPLPIRANSIRLEQRTEDIPTHDGRHTVISKVAFSTRLSRRPRGLFEHREHVHGAFPTSIDRAPGRWSHPQVEELGLFVEKINDLRRIIRTGSLELSKETTTFVRKLKGCKQKCGPSWVFATFSGDSSQISQAWRRF